MGQAQRAVRPCSSPTSSARPSAPPSSATAGWLGALYGEAGRPEDAERHLESLWRDHYWADPYAAFELARLYEQRGDNAAAIVAYDYALAAWRNADPALAPRVEAARRSLTRRVGAED